jgi:hypothetical protein
MNISNDSAIPPGFVRDVPTTLAWDNDDFSEETRSGKETTHITGGVIIQREQSTSTLLQRRDSIPRSRSLPTPSKDINPYFLGKRKTVNSNPSMRTSLDFKSAQFDHIRGEAEDWIKMRGLEI